jgi:hypothetical protein
MSSITLLQDSELAQRKSLVKSFVREILVIGGEAVMHYVSPVRGNTSQMRETFVADGGFWLQFVLVELGGLEPPTSSMPLKRSPR